MNIKSSRINGNLLDEIERLKSKKDSLKEEIKEYVQNINYPLEDRWKVFYDAGEIGIIPESRGIPRWNGNLNLLLNDYLEGEDRHRTIEVPYLFDDIEYKKEEFGENIKEELQEAIIKDFIFSFKYDW